METSPYTIPETALRSWDSCSKRKVYFEGQEEALRQAQSKTPKKAIHALIEEAVKATMDSKEPPCARTYHRSFLCNRTLKGGDSHV